ncbi:cytochrome b/b6 domain-containing protein [Thiolapillus sp.]
MSANRVRVWDLPTRIFHWGLVASFTAAWLLRGDQYLYLHVLAGYLFLFLLLFRVYWGLKGSFHARFSSFIRPLPEAWEYLKNTARGRAFRFLGHNPAGGWAVLLLILLGLMVATTGLLTLGVEEGHGPLAGILGREWSSLFHEIHETLAWLMLCLVAVHLTAVVVESRLHRDNLPLAMVTGYKRRDAAESVKEIRSHPVVALVLLTVMFMFSLWWVKGYFLQSAADPFLPFHGPLLSFDATWEEECGACHLAYHPQLLPGRSWNRLLARQEDHFSEDLYLDAETVSRLREYALANSSDKAVTEAGWKIGESISPAEAPVRITETGYWKEKHGEIPEKVWTRSDISGRHNCVACHLDADRGWFEDSAMRIPASRKNMS